MLYLVKSNENELTYVDLRKKILQWQIQWEMNNLYLWNLIFKKYLVSEISHAIFS
jgi:hypothetical protein